MYPSGSSRSAPAFPSSRSRAPKNLTQRSVIDDQGRGGVDLPTAPAINLRHGTGAWRRSHSLATLAAVVRSMPAVLGRHTAADFPSDETGATGKGVPAGATGRRRLDRHTRIFAHTFE